MTDQSRRQWCAMLAQLVSPSFPDDATAALVAMLPALRHLPDSVFTPDTLSEVAMVKRRQSVPAYDEIVNALNAYRRQFLPDPTLRLAARPNHAIPDGRKGPSPEEVAVVSELLIAWKAEKAAHYASEQYLNQVKPLRDVTLKGEALRQARLRRGAGPVRPYFGVEIPES